MNGPIPPIPADLQTIRLYPTLDWLRAAVKKVETDGQESVSFGIVVSCDGSFMRPFGCMNAMVECGPGDTSQ